MASHFGTNRRRQPATDMPGNPAHPGQRRPCIPRGSQHGPKSAFGYLSRECGTMGSRPSEEDEQSGRGATSSQGGNTADCYPDTPPRITTAEGPFSGTTTALAKSGQDSQYQRGISSGAATLAKMTNSPEPDPAPSHSRYPKAKAACHPRVKPTATPTPTTANSWNHGRRWNRTSAGTPMTSQLTFTLAFTTAQRGR